MPNLSEADPFGGMADWEIVNPEGSALALAFMDMWRGTWVWLWLYNREGLANWTVL